MSKVLAASGGGLLAAHHVEEVARQVELRARGDRRLAAADALPGRDQGRQLRGEAQGLSQRRLPAVVGRVGIERGERRHAGPEHLHRGRLPGQQLEHREELRRELAVRRRGQRLQMRVELLPRRQPPLPQEVGDLLEGRVGHQVVHVVAPVDEPALVAVDEADLRRRDDDVLETSLQGIDRGVRHGSLRFSLGRRWKRLLLPHAPGDFKAASPYTRRRASSPLRRGRLLRPSPHQRGAGAGVRARAAPARRADRSSRRTSGRGIRITTAASGPSRRWPGARPSRRA